MNDSNINRPDFESLNISPKTVAFVCLESDVAELVASIRWDAASILHWRRSSAWFANQMLMRMGGEFVSLEYRAIDLARALCPHLAEDTGKKQVSRWIARLKEDQRLSGFEMIWIDPDRTKRRDDGSFYRLPTLYKPSGFPALYRAVQDAARECDMCKLSLRERRARQRSIIETWLFARDCVSIHREKTTMKEKNGLQLVSNATASEEAGAVVPSTGRVTKDDVERRLTEQSELLFECGQDWMSLGLRLPDYVKKLASISEGIELRLRDAIARSNQPRLKLMGGNAK